MTEFFWYLAMLAATALVLATRSELTSREAKQFVLRALPPLALAGLTEIFLRVPGTIGVVAAVSTYLAVWALIALGILLATIELGLRIAGAARGFKAEGKSFNEMVFSWMGQIYLTPMRIKLGAGEQVEMAAIKSRWATVYPAMIGRGY